MHHYFKYWLLLTRIKRESNDLKTTIQHHFTCFFLEPTDKHLEKRVLLSTFKL